MSVVICSVSTPSQDGIPGVLLGNHSSLLLRAYGLSEADLKFWLYEWAHNRNLLNQRFSLAILNPDRFRDGHTPSHVNET